MMNDSVFKGTKLASWKRLLAVDIYGILLKISTF